MLMVTSPRAQDTCKQATLIHTYPNEALMSSSIDLPLTAKNSGPGGLDVEVIDGATISPAQ